MNLEIELNELSQVLIALGGLLFVGIAADWLGRQSPLPRVTLLLISGFIIGPFGLNWLPLVVIDLFPILTAIALTMIGFLLGQRITRAELGRLGTEALIVSAAVVLLTCVAVSTGLMLLGAPIEVALILGAIATATAPAATLDVIKESGVRGRFSDLLIGIVAIDDVLGLLIFGLLLGVAQNFSDVMSAASLASGFVEIGIAIAIGVALGLPAAFITGRIRSGEPTLAEAVGLVFVTAGISLALGVSYIFSAMVVGAIIANRASHHSRPFHAIEGIEWPFLILFFILAGASLEIQSIETVGLFGIAYFVLRVAGRVGGANIGGLLAGSTLETRRWLGLTLLPQAGIPIGLALHASQVMPSFADAILPVVLGTTIVFELVGPAIARAVLKSQFQ